MSFNNALELYDLEKSKVSFAQVDNKELTVLAENLNQLENAIHQKYNGDDHLSEISSFLKRIFFKFLGSLLPYNQVVNEDKQKELLSKFYEVKSSYPELFSNLVINIAKSFNDLLTINENTMANYIYNKINNDLNRDIEIAIITKRGISSVERAEIIEDPNFTRISFYTEYSFRKEIKVFDLIIYIGSPDYFSPYIRNTFKGKRNTFISYSMFNNSMSMQNEFQDIDRDGSYSTLYDHIKFEKPAKRKVGITFDLKEPLSNIVDKILDGQKTLESDVVDRVEANVVYLENERFLFIPHDSKVRVFLTDEENIKIKQIRFLDIEEDEFIIIRNESDTKLIAEVADKILKPNSSNYRQLQNEWKDRLRTKLNNIGVNRLSQVLLKEYGLKTASPVSIKNWCNENSICPTELRKLLLALDYTESEANSIFNSMQIIKRAHLRAGKLISNKLMSELSINVLQFLQEQGYYTFTSSEFDGASFNIERIVSIDQRIHWVAPYITMKPIKIE